MLFEILHKLNEIKLTFEEDCKNRDIIDPVSIEYLRVTFSVANALNFQI